MILGFTWCLVNLDVQRNEWIGKFYNVVQKALANPGSVSEDELYSLLILYTRIALIYVTISVLLGFFAKHWTFRWRTAMNNRYMKNWQDLRHIEGASQRVQEDTRLFARILESLGSDLVKSLMTLVAFVPILWDLSKLVKVMPFFGEVENALLYLTVGWAVFGTGLLAIVGIRLPGLEFRNQLAEAEYRKELVYGEDNADRAGMPVVQDLFDKVRKNYFQLFYNFCYFDVARVSYLQFGYILPYIALTPTIAAGGITLGNYIQISSAFYHVENSFQFLVRSWATIVDLISVYKRLSLFEASLDDEDDDVKSEIGIEFSSLSDGEM